MTEDPECWQLAGPEKAYSVRRFFRISAGRGGKPSAGGTLAIQGTSRSRDRTRARARACSRARCERVTRGSAATCPDKTVPVDAFVESPWRPAGRGAREPDGYAASCRAADSKPGLRSGLRATGARTRPGQIPRRTGPSNTSAQRSPASSPSSWRARYCHNNAGGNVIMLVSATADSSRRRLRLCARRTLMQCL